MKHPSSYMFLPQSSVIRRTFQHLITKYIVQLPSVDPTWDNVLLSLDGKPRELAFSADGKLLASGALDGAIIWNPATGAVLRELTRVGSMDRVAFSPNGLLLALAGGYEDGFAHVYNVKTGRKVLTYNACERGAFVTFLVFSEDSNLLAAASSAGTITVWDFAKGALRWTDGGHYLRALRFSSEGLLEFQSRDEKVRLLDVSSGKVLRTIHVHFGSPTKYIDEVQFTLTGRLFVAFEDGTSQIYDSNGEPVQSIRLDYTVKPASVELKEDTMLACSRQDMVELLDADCGEKKFVIQRPPGAESHLALSPDNKILAITNPKEHRTEILDVQGPNLSKRWTGYERSMVFAPNGSILASADEDTVELWDPMTATVMRTRAFNESRIGHLCFSADGEILACLDRSSIHLWRLGLDQVQTIRLRIPDDGSFFHELAFSSDYKFVAVAWQGGVILCETSGRIGPRIFPVLDKVKHIAFSSSDDFFAYALCNGMIQRWNLATGAPLPTLTVPDHRKPVVQIAFSSDNKILASVSDASITLWNWDTGTSLQQFHADTDITELSFHDNNQRLETNLEVYALDKDSPTSEPQRVSSRPKFQSNGDWITRNGEDILWLPLGYETWGLTYHDSRVALDLKSGRVVFIGFSR